MSKEICCIHCRLSVQSTSDCLSHELMCNTNIVQCPLCYKPQRTTVDYFQHLQTHKKAEEVALSSQTAVSAIATQMFIEHLRTRNDRCVMFTCNLTADAGAQCSFVSFEPDALDDHIRVWHKYSEFDRAAARNLFDSCISIVGEITRLYCPSNIVYCSTSFSRTVFVVEESQIDVENAQPHWRDLVSRLAHLPNVTYKRREIQLVRFRPHEVMNATFRRGFQQFILSDKFCRLERLWSALFFSGAQPNGIQFEHVYLFCDTVINHNGGGGAELPLIALASLGDDNLLLNNNCRVVVDGLRSVSGGIDVVPCSQIVDKKSKTKRKK